MTLELLQLMLYLQGYVRPVCVQVKVATLLMLGQSWHFGLLQGDLPFGLGIVVVEELLCGSVLD